jgi:toxin YhaV
VTPFDERNGWRLFQHPAFRRQFDALTGEVERLWTALPRQEFEQHAKVRLLARIRKLILEDIPSDPAAKAYEQGNTLGTARRHWRRAKFNQRFRLFFRFQSKARVIVYAWMNDEGTLRARGSRSDVYAVFGHRLESGDPPDDWDDLLSACE